MAISVGHLDEDMALTVIRPWDLQYPRCRHLSSPQQLDGSLRKAACPSFQTIFVESLALRQCLDAARAAAAASRETRSRPRFRDAKPTCNRANLSAMAGARPPGWFVTLHSEHCSTCTPTTAHHCRPPPSTSPGRIAPTIRARHGATARSPA